MTTRKEIYTMATEILIGTRKGDKIAAHVAINVITNQNTLDLLGVTATDVEIDARIVAAYKDAKATGTYNGAPIHV